MKLGPENFVRVRAALEQNTPAEREALAKAADSVLKDGKKVDTPAKHIGKRFGFDLPREETLRLCTFIRNVGREMRANTG